MKRLLLLLTLMLCSSMAAAEIYKWVDKDGTMHFSDQPKLGATTVNLPEQAVKEPTTPTPVVNPNNSAATPAATTSDPSTATPIKHEYTTLTIVDPADQGTVRDNNGTIIINLKVVPLILPGDKFQVLLDGKPFGPTQSQAPVQISGVDRGEHQLAVEIQDKDGKVLRTSDSITIFMHQAMIDPKKKKSS